MGKSGRQNGSDKGMGRRGEKGKTGAVPRHGGGLWRCGGWGKGDERPVCVSSEPHSADAALVAPTLLVLPLHESELSEGLRVVVRLSDLLGRLEGGAGLLGPL